jgi:hypothetical protein
MLGLGFPALVEATSVLGAVPEVGIAEYHWALWKRPARSEAVMLETSASRK